MDSGSAKDILAVCPLVGVVPFRIESTFGFAFGFPFTLEGILRFAPHDSGVYVINNATGCLYVGESAAIDAALLEHLQSDSEASACIRQGNPTEFSFERCARGLCLDRQKQLLSVLKPFCQLPNRPSAIGPG